MKVLIAGLVLFAGNVFAHPQQDGPGYQRRLDQSRQIEMVDWNREAIYVNSLDELPPGRWQCQDVNTYQGGPKSPYTQSYYVCRRARR